MSSKGYTGTGVVLQVGNSTGGASTSWSTIANILDGPSRTGRQVTAIDTTCHGDNEKTKMPGKLDEGQATFQILYEPESATYILLNTIFIARAKRDFKLIEPNTAASSRVFVGFILSIADGRPDDDKMTCDITIEIDGAETFTASPTE